MKKFQLYSAWLALALLTACTAIGSVQPQDFNERLAASYATITSIRDTATSLLQRKRISSADHKVITDQLVSARTALDSARILSRQNPDDANARLTAVRAVLSALQEQVTSEPKVIP